MDMIEVIVYDVASFHSLVDKGWWTVSIYTKEVASPCHFLDA